MFERDRVSLEKIGAQAALVACLVRCLFDPVRASHNLGDASMFMGKRSPKDCHFVYRLRMVASVQPEEPVALTKCQETDASVKQLGRYGYGSGSKTKESGPSLPVESRLGGVVGFLSMQKALKA